MISSLIFIPKPVFGNLLRHFWMLFWQGRNIFSVHFTIYVFCCWDLTSIMTMTILRRKGKFWTWIVLLNYAKLLFKSEISNCFWYIFISCSYPVLLSMELLVFDCVFTVNQHGLCTKITEIMNEIRRWIGTRPIAILSQVTLPIN